MASTHAVVIGGSFSGLFAGRVLSDFFDRVTVLDRDSFPAGVEDPASGLFQGTPVNALGTEPISDPEAAAYLCGPPPMIEAARQRLAELGVSPERIYAERFVAS